MSFQDEIQKAIQARRAVIGDNLSKGKKGSGAPIGTIKEMGGRNYIKAADGTWKYHGHGTGAKAQAHASGANSPEHPTPPAPTNKVEEEVAAAAPQIPQETAPETVESTDVVTQGALDYLDSLYQRAVKDKWKGWAAKELKKESKALVVKVYQHSKVRKALAEIGLETSKYRSTAIRGYREFTTRGYEISKYDPNTISFQISSEERIDKAEEILRSKGLFQERTDKKTIKIKPTSDSDAQKVKRHEYFI